MTNTISVPRELLERATFPYTGVETIHTTRQIALDDIRALLRAAPAAEVEGLEVVAWMTTADKDGPKTAVTMSLEASRQQHSNWLRQSRSITTEPLCFLPKALAIIDQQAARIAELQKDADRYRWLCEYGYFRAMSMDMGGNHSWTGAGRHIGKGVSIDAAIDAAMGRR